MEALWGQRDRPARGWERQCDACSPNKNGGPCGPPLALDARGSGLRHPHLFAEVVLGRMRVVALQRLRERLIAGSPQRLHDRAILLHDLLELGDHLLALLDVEDAL